MKKSIGRMAAKARETFTRYMAQRNLWKQKALELAKENERLKLEAQQARAQLCQLRVDPGSYHGRIGYMVGTFVPEEVVKKLRDNPQHASDFKHLVVDKMMESVLRGFLFRKLENNKCVALVFLPRGEKFTRSTVLPVFECEGKHEMHVPKELRDEINREIELQQQRERRLLGY